MVPPFLEYAIYCSCRNARMFTDLSRRHGRGHRDDQPFLLGVEPVVTHGDGEGKQSKTTSPKRFRSSIPAYVTRSKQQVRTPQFYLAVSTILTSAGMNAAVCSVCVTGERNTFEAYA